MLAIAAKLVPRVCVTDLLYLALQEWSSTDEGLRFFSVSLWEMIAAKVVPRISHDNFRSVSCAHFSGRLMCARLAALPRT
mmetsp:Transcript_177998/g.564931  ORF Transcript_177998/g.564931 Transcript_177998/m.564931 type:complete len:80 (-) Transcript_177998:53-292(-)